MVSRCPITRAGAYRRFSRGFELRDALGHPEQYRILAGEFLSQETNLILQAGYKCGAIRLRLAGVLPMFCRVLSWPAGVQKDPHTAVGVLLVGDSTPLHTLSDSIHRSAEMIGGLRDANTLGGRMS